jgi:RIO kinase 1
VPDYAFNRRANRRFLPDGGDDDGELAFAADDEPDFAKRNRHRRRLPAADAFDAADGLPEGDRWSTWDQPSASERGPRPYPAWLVTELAAVDTELGILKTGKEADVFLVRRGVPGTGRSCCSLPSGTATPSTRCSTATVRTWKAGGPGSPGPRGPWPAARRPAGRRLAETRPQGTELADLWDQLVQAMVTLARLGLAHGDMSPYNLLVHRGRLVMIDLPQVVDVIANPGGPGFLDRDAANVAKWFAARGLAAAAPGAEDLAALLRREALTG